MPCYDPPPEWAGRAQANAEKAAQLLCANVNQALEAGRTPPNYILEWYLEHREIDRERAQDGRFKVTVAEYVEIQLSIDMVKKLLEG